MQLEVLTNGFLKYRLAVHKTPEESWLDSYHGGNVLIKGFV